MCLALKSLVPLRDLAAISDCKAALSSVAVYINSAIESSVAGDCNKSALFNVWFHLLWAVIVEGFLQAKKVTPA